MPPGEDLQVLEAGTRDDAQVHSVRHQFAPDRHRTRKFVYPHPRLGHALKLPPAPERKLLERYLLDRPRVWEARALAELGYCLLARAVRPACVEAVRVVPRY